MQTDKMLGKLPAGANFSGQSWVNIQILPDMIAKNLRDGAVITMELVPGTGDVRYIATMYGKAIDIPAVKS